jgi:hypothetical protein
MAGLADQGEEPARSVFELCGQDPSDVRAITIKEHLADGSDAAAGPQAPVGWTGAPKQAELLLHLRFAGGLLLVRLRDLELG